jgi:hypothetical protein
LLEELWPQYTRWYIEQVRSAINGGKGETHLAYRKVRHLWDIAEHQVVLLVILDGLLPDDAHGLVNMITGKCPEWDVSETTFAASIVPTITEYCKTSLIYGCPPIHAGAGSLEVRSRKDAIAAGRQAVARGHGFVAWVFDQPDWTYHSKSDSPESTRYEVDKVMHSIGVDIVSVLNELTNGEQVSIVLTSDHGRALGACPRQLIVPDGGTQHGRVVHLPTPYPDDNPFTVHDDGLASLNEKAFGIGEGTSYLPLGDWTFSANLGGVAWYEHGGVLPEETNVPWFTLNRGGTEARLIGTSTLQGIVGRSCELIISLSNPGSIELSPTKASIRLADGALISVALPLQSLKPLDVRNVSASVHVSTSAVLPSQLTIEARKPNGESREFVIPLTANLRALQDRAINLVEDFDI